MKCNFLTAGSSWMYSAKAGWFSVFDSQGFILMRLYSHMFMYTCVWKPEDNLRNIIYLLWDSVSLLAWSFLVNTSMACQQIPNVLLFTLPSSGIANRTLLNAFKNEFWESSSRVTHLRWAHTDWIIVKSLGFSYITVSLLRFYHSVYRNIYSIHIYKHMHIYLAFFGTLWWKLH